MAGSTNRPVSFETVVRTRPVASAVIVTVTPGRTAPDMSTTLPLNSPVANPCPKAAGEPTNTLRLTIITTSFHRIPDVLLRMIVSAGPTTR